MGVEAGLCHVRTLTDFPCATCGGTRAALSILRGNVVAAVQLNPLVTLALFAAGLVFALRLIKGQKLVLQFGRRGWIVSSIILLAAFAANWVYVLWRHLGN